MTKPTVYLDTTVISAYWFEGNKPIVAARRMHSRRWWNEERQFFTLYTSAVSESEFRAGSTHVRRNALK